MTYDNHAMARRFYDDNYTALGRREARSQALSIEWAGVNWAGYYMSHDNTLEGAPTKGMKSSTISWLEKQLRE